MGNPGCIAVGIFRIGFEFDDGIALNVGSPKIRESGSERMNQAAAAASVGRLAVICLIVASTRSLSCSSSSSTVCCRLSKLSTSSNPSGVTRVVARLVFSVDMAGYCSAFGAVGIPHEVNRTSHASFDAQGE